MKAKTIIISVISALILFTLISSVQACSCIYLEDAKSKLNNADFAFSGEITNIKLTGSSGNEMQELTVKIMDYWKPEAFPESVNLIVYAPKDTGANCGYNFQKGEKYLIYAYKNGETNELNTNSCAGNLKLNQAENEINELNNINNNSMNQNNNSNQSNNSSNSNNQNTNNPNIQDKPNLFTRLFNWLKNLFS